MQNTINDIQTTEVAQSTAMTALALSSNGKSYTKCYSVQHNITVTTPSAGTLAMWMD